MPIPKRIKQLISRFTDKEIPIGTGVTTDDELIIDDQLANTAIGNTKKPIFNNSIKYHLKPNAGSFELVGLVKSTMSTAYQLRHVATGTTFNVPPQLFNLLFKKYIVPKA